MTDFKIGDIVRIKDSGKTFTTYDDWFNNYEPFLGLRYAYCKTPTEGTIGIVVAIHSHMDMPCNLVAIENINNSYGYNEIYLVDERGLEYIND